MDELKTNVLYYGDNLEILRKYIPDNSVDLIYLDPPFNSKATYNVLFREPTGKPSQAQISAFEDSWHWGLESERALQEIAASAIAPAPVKEFMSVLPELVGKRTDMAAYLTMICIRLVELRRVLRDTGSLYLHCDPTASHYLKLLLDQIFGPANFRNEVVWRRSQTRSSISRIFKRAHDVIFVYSKSPDYYFQIQYKDLSETSLKLYSKKDNRGLYQPVPLLVSGKRKGATGKPWKGIDPNLQGKGGCHWITVPSKLEEYEKNGLIEWPIKANGLPRLKYYLEDNKGVPVTDFWDDIDLIPSSSNEALGYDTQKPLALLERIIQASSNEGDVVLDPFCGCGTAVVAAQELNRKWIGIDITYLAIGLMEWRLKNMVPMPVYKVVGEPEDLASAVELANKDKYQFQWWAVTKVGGQPYGDKKKGADTGIDGYIYYMDEKDKIKKAIISVKGGKNTNVSMIRDLGHVIDREKSDIGIFILLEKPTRPMIEEAAKMGFYHSPLGRDYPRIQITTIEDIFQGKLPDIPPWIAPIAKPKLTKKAEGEQLNEISSMRISLEKAGVHGVPEYIKVLQANSNSENFGDFYLEGKAALMFKAAGCEVSLRESPDLFLKFNNERFYAEVKHVREKEQDRKDAAKMSEPGDELVLYGDTVPPAWEQVYNVAKKKVTQYKEDAPNILVIESSSTSIEDAEIPSAIDMINKDIRSGKCPEFVKLNGILLITVGWYNISQSRGVFYYPTSNPAISLSNELSEFFNNIRIG